MIVFYLLLLPFAYYADFKKTPKHFIEDLKGGLLFTVLQVMLVLILRYTFKLDILIIVMSLGIEILVVFSLKALIKAS